MIIITMISLVTMELGDDGSAERAAETVTDLERPVQDQPVQDQPRGIPSDNLPPSFAPTVNRKGQRPSIKSVVLPNVAANAAGAAAGTAPATTPSRELHHTRNAASFHSSSRVRRGCTADHPHG